jgi:putative ABC transport system permease protein
MIGFLAKGLLRDRSRSFFPTLIIAAGVMITVILFCWIQGAMEMFLDENARLDSGHLKVVTRAYNEIIDQKPFDLGFLNLQETISDLEEKYPQMIWLPRTNFGGLLDIADEAGETISQGKVICLALEIINSDIERDLMQLDQALVVGKIPENPDQILISNEIADKMNISLMDTVTIITSTVYGSMSFENFIVTGTLQFGIKVMDRGTVLMDTRGMQNILDMENGAAEILGFFPNFSFNAEQAREMQQAFNTQFSDPEDEYSPYMLTLLDQNSMEYMVSSMDSRLNLIIFIFVFVMSLVLWNSGLMNGIRRYGEIGVRMAIGESKLHVYTTMLIESLLIAITGSFIGTILGLLLSYFLQEQGIDISSMMENVNMIMNTTMRARITPEAIYIGFIPGLLASLLGAVFSGIGIFRRDTAQLFKELEA